MASAPRLHDHAPKTSTIVIMGVSGAGKTTAMTELVRRLGWPMAEGDSFHPAANVEKMRSGHPLTDEDRWPWLEALAGWIGEREEAHENALVSCSALKRSYRDLLRRGHPSVWFAHLIVPQDVLLDRVEHRHGHYMPPSLLTSQLDTLEPLAQDEPGAAIPSMGDPKSVVDVLLERLATERPHMKEPLHAGG